MKKLVAGIAAAIVLGTLPTVVQAPAAMASGPVQWCDCDGGTPPFGWG